MHGGCTQSVFVKTHIYVSGFLVLSFEKWLWKSVFAPLPLFLKKCYGLILPVLTIQKHQEFQLFAGVVQETLMCYGHGACSTGLLKVFAQVV